MTDPIQKSSWLRITPDRCLIALLGFEGLLLLSEQFHWFAFNEKKGWTVLIAAASVVAAGVLLSLWFAASLLFRWRFRFSIRSLFILVLVIAIPSSWLSMKKQRAEKQKESLEALRSAGGYFRYEYQDWGDVIWEDRQPSGPAWLRNLLGGDFFDTVNGVEFADPKTDDSVMEIVEKFPDLEWLDITGTSEPYKSLIRTQITDAGMEHLAKLNKLKYLFVPGSQITGVGLRHLEGLTHLTCLDIRNTNVTDVGIQHLKALKHLTDLCIDNTRITDAGLENLTDLRYLEDVDLQQTAVTDAGVKKLQQALPSCKIVR